MWSQLNLHLRALRSSIEHRRSPAASHFRLSTFRCCQYDHGKLPMTQSLSQRVTKLGSLPSGRSQAGHRRTVPAGAGALVRVRPPCHTTTTTLAKCCQLDNSITSVQMYCTGMHQSGRRRKLPHIAHESYAAHADEASAKRYTVVAQETLASSSQACHRNCTSDAAASIALPRDSEDPTVRVSLSQSTASSASRFLEGRAAASTPSVVKCRRAR